MLHEGLPAHTNPVPRMGQPRQAAHTRPERGSPGTQNTGAQDARTIDTGNGRHRDVRSATGSNGRHGPVARGTWGSDGADAIRQAGTMGRGCLCRGRARGHTHGRRGPVRVAERQQHGQHGQRHDGAGEGSAQEGGQAGLERQNGGRGGCRVIRGRSERTHDANRYT